LREKFIAMASHKVVVDHGVNRVRAVCGCGWKSPWVTAHVRPDEDVPMREQQQIVSRATNAARWHLGQVATA
jgi:hypothetical protein